MLSTTLRADGQDQKRLGEKWTIKTYLFMRKTLFTFL